MNTLHKEWTPTSKQRLQDTLYYGFFWVQKYGSKKPYPVWRSSLPSHTDYVLTHNFEDGSSIHMDEIEAWFRPDHISLPEPYVTPKSPKSKQPKTIETWIDGEKRWPKKDGETYKIFVKEKTFPDGLKTAVLFWEYDDYDGLYEYGSFNVKESEESYQWDDVWWLEVKKEGGADE